MLENRKNTVTYWAAQQLWLHNKCQNNTTPTAPLKGKEISSVMPLHIPGELTDNRDELKIKHEVISIFFSFSYFYHYNHYKYF